MDFDLTPEQEEFRKAVRTFAEDVALLRRYGIPEQDWPALAEHVVRALATALEAAAARLERPPPRHGAAGAAQPGCP